MKRVIPAALIGALLVVGCNNKKKPEPTAPPSELSPSSTLPPAPPAQPQYIPAEPAQPSMVTPAPTAPKAAAPKATAPKATAPKAAAPKTSSKVYVVKKGDTLGEIAQSHKTTISKIKAINPGLNPDKIMAGQKIKLP